MSKVIKLSEVGKIITGNTPKTDNADNYSSNDICFFKPSDIKENEICSLNVSEYYISEFARQKTKMLPVGTILVTCIGIIGKVAVIAQVGTCNQQINAIIPYPGFDNRYIAYSIYNSRHTLRNLANAPVVPILNKKQFSNIEIKYHPLETQKKIADVLDKAKSLIDLRKKQIEKMDLLIKSKFIEMFGDPATNPKGWVRRELREITSKIGSGATPRGGKESYIKYGICLIRSMNVHNGKFKYEELAHIDESQAKQLENVTVFENDVLINITGASVARSCVVPKTTLPARVNQHVSIIRCDPKVISHQYMNKLLINDSYQNILLLIAGAGGATREAITKRQLELLEIPLPPLDLQNQFACFVESVENQKNLLEQALVKMEINYKSMMQEYFW